MSWKVEDTPMKWVSLPMPIGMCSHQCLLQEDPSSSIREQLPAKGQNNARFNLKFSLLASSFFSENQYGEFDVTSDNNLQLKRCPIS